MSDTTTQLPEDEEQRSLVSSIANYSTNRKQAKWNGQDEEWVEVKFGRNPVDPSLPAMVVEIRRTDMGDQFDLVEIASNQVENDVWLSLAIVAMSVRSIDGVPQPTAALSKLGLKAVLRKIGPTGVRAVRTALSELDLSLDTASQRTAAGN